MTVLSFSIGDLFTVRVIKYLTTNPDNKWANSYEFKALLSGSDAELGVLVSSLVLFEVALHHDVVAFDRVLVSTWEADSVPYNPNVFLSIPQSANGAVGPVGDNLALDKTLAVARVPQSGRFGHLFYRGVLNEADTSAPAGKTILGDRSGIQDNVDAAALSSEFTDYIGADPGSNFGLVMISADGETVRPVVSLTVQGVSTLPTDHAWFNRTSP